MNKNTLKKEIKKTLARLDGVLAEIRNYEINTDEDSWDYDYYEQLLGKLEEANIILADEDDGLLVQIEEYQTATEDE